VALTQLGEQRVDGWLVLTYLQGLELLAQQGKPIVTISDRIPEQTFPSVVPDNRQGMEVIMQHLLNNGHRRIAFAGDITIGDIRERFTSYQKILKTNGISYDPEIVVLTDNPLADRGTLAARELLARGQSFSAVACGNDLTAIGLMRELQAQGYRIPDDIAVVGFDDIPEVQVTDPPISSVRQHADLLGSTAAEILLAQIAGEAVVGGMHYIPTMFMLRESSGVSLNQRIAGWASPDIAAGNQWQGSLAKELVRVLLPALPLVPTPSPAHVWREVDMLVEYLGLAIDGDPARTVDHRQLAVIFSSQPFANANPETLVQMLRILETAGSALIAERADAEQARLRLAAFLDQLNIEVMRSYRRRQSSAQHTLNENLRSQYVISQLLLDSPPQQVDWLKETTMNSGCLGLWTPFGDDQPPVVGIAGCYQRRGSSMLRAGVSISAPLFPPLDLLPSSTQEKGITTCLVLTVRTADHDWGMLAVSGPLISNDPWLEDYSVNFLETCCGFLGMALKQETLLETLRHASENEQYLADRMNEITFPLISIREGVWLIPLDGILGVEQTAQKILAALEQASITGTQDIILDMSRVPQIHAKGIQGLATIVRILSSRGMRLVLTGVVPNVQKQIDAEGPDLKNVPVQPGIEAALIYLQKEPFVKRT
jgi:anti-anti-sigma regulatory factor